MSARTLRAAAVLLSGWPSVLLAQVPERSDGAQTLRVPQAHLDRGQIYFLLPGGDSQVVLRSNAMLQTATVTTNRAVGYFEAPFAPGEEPGPPLRAGAFRIPVASLRTGVDGGDERLAGPGLLDAARHPEMTFLLASVAGAEPGEKNDEMVRFRATLSGTLTVKGASRPLSLPCRLTFIPSTERTMARVDGDLLFVDCAFALRPSEWGFAPDEELRDRLAEELDVEVHFALSTMSPDQPYDLRDDRALHAKRLRVACLFRDFDDRAAGHAAARALLEEVKDRPAELARLATALVAASGLRPAPLGLALEAAQRAVVLDKEAEPVSLEALALVQYARGELEAAEAAQRKAVARHRPGSRSLDRARSTLAAYEKERNASGSRRPR